MSQVESGTQVNGTEADRVYVLFYDKWRDGDSGHKYTQVIGVYRDIEDARREMDSCRCLKMLDKGSGVEIPIQVSGDGISCRSIDEVDVIIFSGNSTIVPLFLPQANHERSVEQILRTHFLCLSRFEHRISVE